MSKTLEQRASRLAISMGVCASKIENHQQREMFFGKALIEVLEDLIGRGQRIDDAAPMADDIIAGARMISREARSARMK